MRALLQAIANKPFVVQTLVSRLVNVLLAHTVRPPDTQATAGEPHHACLKSCRPACQYLVHTWPLSSGAKRLTAVLLPACAAQTEASGAQGWSRCITIASQAMEQIRQGSFNFNCQTALLLPADAFCARCEAGTATGYNRVLKSCRPASPASSAADLPAKPMVSACRTLLAPCLSPQRWGRLLWLSGCCSSPPHVHAASHG